MRCMGDVRCVGEVSEVCGRCEGDVSEVCGRCG